MAQRMGEPGVATGLAWTPAGGDILFIEATKMKNQKGGLILTGQLGDVMKESARAALSYIQANADQLGIETSFFENHEIHIHVPAGAIPKDGPSAGVTMATSLLSLILNVPARSDVAMTGEITLRGKILPIGGLKEKVLAAKRAGISKVLMPERNRRDFDDIPENVKKDMKFHYVNSLDEVFDLALETRPIKRKNKQEIIRIPEGITEN